MDADEAAAFLARPWAADAVTLRRADDSGKVEGLVVGDLASWTPLLQDVAAGRSNRGRARQVDAGRVRGGIARLSSTTIERRARRDTLRRARKRLRHERAERLAIVS